METEEQQSHRSRAAGLLHDKLRRQSASDLLNAQQKRDLARTALAEARKIAGPAERVGPLVEVLTSIVKRDDDAFDAFDRYTELLDEAEGQLRSAVAAREEAFAAYQLGSADPGEAMRLFTALEVAKSAAMFRSDEYERAKRPARLPSAGMPPEAADPDTKELVRLWTFHNVDFAGSLVGQRFGTDVAKIAADQGRLAEPKQALWWILAESRAYETLKRKTQKPDREELAALFDHRWTQYERIQALSELERDRERRDIRQ